MLSLFTKYLVHYGKVCIPHIGTFELIRQPPQLDVADQLFIPPSYITAYHPQELISEHQRDFFASCFNTAKEKTATDLVSFGEKLKKRLRHKPFQWNGFGTLHLEQGGIAFDPYQIYLDSFTSVPAHKIMRQNVQHSILVGDQQMTSEQVAEALIKTDEKKNFYMMIGWVLLILALITISIVLYFGKFQPSSSGLRW